MPSWSCLVTHPPAACRLLLPGKFCEWFGLKADATVPASTLNLRSLIRHYHDLQNKVRVSGFCVLLHVGVPHGRLP